MIVDEALKEGKDVMGPVMRDGDRIGWVYQDGEVISLDSRNYYWRVLNIKTWPGVASD